MKIILQNSETKEYTSFKMGINWLMPLATVLFAMWLVPLYRKDYIHSVIALIVQLVVCSYSFFGTEQDDESIFGGIIALAWIFTFIYFMFFYNKVYYRNIIKKNFKLVHASAYFLRKNEVKGTYFPLSEEELKYLKPKLKTKNIEKFLIFGFCGIINFLIFLTLFAYAVN